MFLIQNEFFNMSCNPTYIPPRNLVLTRKVVQDRHHTEYLNQIHIRNRVLDLSCVKHGSRVTKMRGLNKCQKWWEFYPTLRPKKSKKFGVLGIPQKWKEVEFFWFQKSKAIIFMAILTPFGVFRHGVAHTLEYLIDVLHSNESSHGKRKRSIHSIWIRIIL